MAGFFGFFDYSKPGKGVSKDEPAKPRFLFFWELFFRKFWKLMQLNLLYILSCLFVVTIGPATAGFIYVLRNFANEQPVFLVSDYWDAIKNNWKQSLGYSVFSLVIPVALTVSCRFYLSNIETVKWMYVPFSVCVLLLLLFVFMSFYVMLMIVTLDLKLTEILKNAAIFAIIGLKTNFMTLFFILLIMFAGYLLQGIGFLLTLLIIPAMIGFIICFNMYPKIKKYAIDPYLEKQQAAEDPGTGAQPDESAIFSDRERKKHQD